MLVHLTKRKKEIHIAAKSNMINRYKCYKLVDEIAERVMFEVLNRSQGTDISETYISQRALKENQTLEDVWTFTKEELERAKRNTSGAITRKGKMESVFDILCQGRFNKQSKKTIQ